MRLYGTPESSATYRVRIALNLKGLEAEQVTVNLRRGEHRTLTYLERNPQGLVPLLEDGEVRLGQSLAILEYLEELYPEPPLLPQGALSRARVRSLAMMIASDIQPLGNRRVLHHLRGAFKLDEEEIAVWNRHWFARGFAPIENELKRTAGRYAFGDQVGMADACLIPQLYNTRRYGFDLKPYPIICRIEASCLDLPAFDRARPEMQLDLA